MHLRGALCATLDQSSYAVLPNHSVRSNTSSGSCRLWHLSLGSYRVLCYLRRVVNLRFGVTDSSGRTAVAEYAATSHPITADFMAGVKLMRQFVFRDALPLFLGVIGILLALLARKPKQKQHESTEV
jgi:hypothetical protein